VFDFRVQCGVHSEQAQSRFRTPSRLIGFNCRTLRSRSRSRVIGVLTFNCRMQPTDETTVFSETEKTDCKYLQGQCDVF